MEYITANGTEFKCQKVTTGNDTISFTMEGYEIAEVKAAFEDVSELSVSGEDKLIYGTYEHLSFELATVYKDGSIMVTMHIPDATELRLMALEGTQAEQDEAIAALMFGGDTVE